MQPSYRISRGGEVSLRLEDVHVVARSSALQCCKTGFKPDMVGKGVFSKDYWSFACILVRLGKKNNVQYTKRYLKMGFKNSSNVQGTEKNA